MASALFHVRRQIFLQDHILHLAKIKYSNLSAKEKFEQYKKTSLRKTGVAATEMDPSILWPPEAVRGIKVLNVSAFKKTISVPVAKVDIAHIGPVLKVLKKYFLKLRRFSSHFECPENPGVKMVYLNPLVYSEKEKEIKSEVNAASSEAVVEFATKSLELCYDNWDANLILRAVLPLGEDGVAGYSKVGHILHLNLKEHIEPYKTLIGTVLLDKSHDDVTMIVNKIDTIDNSDNTFRSFSMEVLAGEGDTVATVKQNKCSFMFDFAKVYWNSRLSTEHEIVFKKLSARDILYDVMAGVGPFSIPAAIQSKCRVLANDLNPESYHWLQYNCTLNKVQQRVSCHNLDGKQFITDVIKDDLIKLWKDPDFDGNIHVTMNLPSIAVEFLPAFVGLLSDVDVSCMHNMTEPIVHVYMFSKDQKVSSCVTRVAYYLGLVDTLPDFDGEVSAALSAAHDNKHVREDNSSNGTAEGPNNHQQLFGKQGGRSTHKLVRDDIEIDGLDVVEVTFVRRVAPVKVMVRVGVKLTKQILLSPKGRSSLLGSNKVYCDDNVSASLGSNAKRQKIEL